MNQEVSAFVYGYGFYHTDKALGDFPFTAGVPLDASRAISEKDRLIFDRHYDAMETIHHHANLGVKANADGSVIVHAEAYTHSAMGGPGVTGTDLTAAANIDFAVKYCHLDVSQGKTKAERNLIRLNALLLQHVQGPTQSRLAFEEVVRGLYAFSTGHRANAKVICEKLKNVADVRVREAVLAQVIAYLQETLAPEKMEKRATPLNNC